MTDDDEFDAVIDSAYSEPLMITGAIGDDDLTQVAPTPPRPGVDLGDAGSLVQVRDQLRRRHSADRGPLTRDRVTIMAILILLASAVGVGTIIGGAKIPGPTILAVLLVPALLIILAGSAWVLLVRYGPTAADRNLSATITAEQRAGRDLGGCAGRLAVGAAP